MRPPSWFTPSAAAYEEEADAAAVRLFLTPLLADDRVAIGVPREDAVFRTCRRLPELVCLSEPVDSASIAGGATPGCELRVEMLAVPSRRPTSSAVMSLSISPAYWSGVQSRSSVRRKNTVSLA